MTRAVIAIGSNIDPEHHVQAAVERLGELPTLQVIAVSPMYRTTAVGGDYPDFINGAVLVDTDDDPATLRSRLRQIEDGLGRVRTEDRNAPRTIDLDIVLFEGLTGLVDGSEIPDPDFIDNDIERYGHIAIPAADVAPDWEVGTSGRTLRDVAAGMPREDISEL